jgi:hypothetical protein
MVRLNPPFDITVDFWANNPEYIYIEPFNKFYKEKDSSNLMWALWLYTSKSEYNVVKNLPEKQKIEVIKRYYKKFDLDNKDIKNAITKFNVLSKSNAARAFSEEEDTLVKRAESIVKMQELADQVLTGRYADELSEDEELVTPFSAEFKRLMDIIEGMRKNTQKVYQAYEEAKDVFLQEEGEETLYGGGKLNPIDKQELPDLDD